MAGLPTRLLLMQGLGPHGTVAGRVRALFRSTRLATLWLEPPPVSLIRKKGLEAVGELAQTWGWKVFREGPTAGTPTPHRGDAW